MKKIERCEFCNAIIDRDDPFFEFGALKLGRKELEEIRRYMAFHLNQDGMFNINDMANDYVNSPLLVTAYKELTRFLMK